MCIIVQFIPVWTSAYECEIKAERRDVTEVRFVRCTTNTAFMDVTVRDAVKYKFLTGVW
jgi:hypothetical protein